MMAFLCRLVLVAGVLAVSGCGGAPEGPRRVEFSGSVTRDGKPVPNASISLFPTASSHGVAANGSIVDGYFEIASEVGPSPGDYLVAVQFILSKQELISSQNAGSASQTDWEFPLTIPDQDTFEHNFVLE